MILKGIKSGKKIMINFRVLKEEREKIVSNAKKYAGGNLTAWLIHSAINYIPKKKEME